MHLEALREKMGVAVSGLPRVDLRKVRESLVRESFDEERAWGKAMTLQQPDAVARAPLATVPLCTDRESCASGEPGAGDRLLLYGATSLPDSRGCSKVRAGIPRTGCGERERGRDERFF